MMTIKSQSWTSINYFPKFGAYNYVHREEENKYRNNIKSM